MPNRIIKESICKSETLDKLTAEEERLFYRLLVNCDDFGRFDAKPAIVKNQCFRLDEGKLKIEIIERWINRLCEVGLIILYENHSKKYLQFVTWHEHQQQRANNSKYPDPESEESTLISIDINCNQLKPVLANSDRLRISNTNTNTNKGGVGEKKKFAEYVHMKPDEYQSLLDKFGIQGTNERIEALNLWKGSKGKKTASDYLTILNWERRKKEEKPQNKPPQTTNHDQRKYSETEINKFYKDV